MVNKKFIIKLCICLLWITFIFYNGSRQGEQSQQASGTIVKVVDKVINPQLSPAEKGTKRYSQINYYVRKNAHFFEYFILGILLCLTIYELKLSVLESIFMILFFMLIFPTLDEFMQRFVPNRTSNVKDIIIDFSGGTMGILLYHFKNIVFKKGYKTYNHKG